MQSRAWRAEDGLVPTRRRTGSLCADALCADAVWLVHAAVTGFFLVAWALPWTLTLWIAVVGALLMRVQWWLCDGVCVLTKLERLLRGLPAAPGVHEEAFLSALMARLAGRPLPRAFSDAITYAALWGGAGIALVRLVHRL